MSKHLADKRKPSEGARLKQFLRLAHDDASTFWQQFRRRPVAQMAVQPAAGRRMAEFARIARGRQV